MSGFGAFTRPDPKSLPQGTPQGSLQQAPLYLSSSFSLTNTRPNPLRCVNMAASRLCRSTHDPSTAASLTAALHQLTSRTLHGPSIQTAPLHHLLTSTTPPRPVLAVLICTPLCMQPEAQPTPKRPPRLAALTGTLHTSGAHELRPGPVTASRALPCAPGAPRHRLQLCVTSTFYSSRPQRGSPARATRCALGSKTLRGAREPGTGSRWLAPALPLTVRSP